MTGQESFIAAICAAPKDDLPRLVFADWLDEQGTQEGADRAEFIRIGCERASLPICHDDHYHMSPEGQRCHSPSCVLWRRERELLAAHEIDWLPAVMRPAPGSRPGLVRIGWRTAWRRGFIAELYAPWSSIRDHIAAVRKAHPIEKVVLTTVPECSVEHFPQLRRWRAWLAGVPTREFYEVDDRMLSRAGGADAVRELARQQTAWLLGRAWPGIEWELPPANPYEALGLMSVRGNSLSTELTRDQIEAAVRRRLPVGRSVMWVRDEAEPGAAVSEFHHVCPDDPHRGSLPPVGESIYRRIDVRRVRVRLNDEQVRRDYHVPEQVVEVFAGRCPHCEVIFLAEAR